MATRETWAPVPFLPEYEASSFGRVRLTVSHYAGPNGALIPLNQEPTFGQWDKTKRRFQISRKGKTYKVHQMVCAAFNGPKPFPAAVAMHGDENSANNRADNLSWGTQKQNLNAPGFLAYCSSRRGDLHPRKKHDRAAKDSAALLSQH